MHILNLRKFFSCFFKRRTPKQVRQPQTVAPLREVKISEFDNLWNQLALELSRPHLDPNYKIDEKKVAELQQKLVAFERSGKSRWD